MSGDLFRFLLCLFKKNKQFGWISESTKNAASTTSEDALLEKNTEMFADFNLCSAEVLNL